MDGVGVQKIADLAQEAAKVQELQINGLTFTDAPIHLVPDERAVSPAKALGIHTLQGFADYVNGQMDADLRRQEDDDPAAEAHVIQVSDHENVFLWSPLMGRGRVRECLVTASFVPLIGGQGTRFEFGKFLKVDTFLIGLKTFFVDSETVQHLVTMVGNVRTEKVQHVVDDGFSQAVTTQGGAVQLAVKTLPSTVTLAPYRTFPEVEQPESTFVLRAKPGEDEQSLPTFALFEADGGKWKLDAIARIKAFLAERIKDVRIIA